MAQGRCLAEGGRDLFGGTSSSCIKEPTASRRTSKDVPGAVELGVC